MAPGCFSQSTNNKQSVPFTLVTVASSMNLKPTDRTIHPSASPLSLSLSEGNKRAGSEFKTLFLLSPAELNIDEIQSNSNPNLNLNLNNLNSTDCYLSATSEIQSTQNTLDIAPDSSLAEINLDEIPLPLTPPPNRRAYEDYVMDGDRELVNEDNNVSQQPQGNNLGNVKLSCCQFSLLPSSTTHRLSSSLRPRSKPKSIRQVSLHSLISDYTVDTFEILEQTIIKQKKLAKLKNTDLRKKMLLKRMFDRICDTMDMENGFKEDYDASSTPMVSGNSSNVACEEAEETSELELELHDHSMMDEDESDNEEPTRLAELKPVREETDSQVLPHQKRRTSCGHNNDKNEETFFCESHSSDQQLNWRCSHDARAMLPDLKIYSDDSNASTAVSIKKSRRTDHQRNAKRIRTH